MSEKIRVSAWRLFRAPWDAAKLTTQTFGAETLTLSAGAVGKRSQDSPRRYAQCIGCTTLHSRFFAVTAASMASTNADSG
jgi:hypothetical protein